MELCRFFEGLEGMMRLGSLLQRRIRPPNLGARSRVSRDLARALDGLKVRPFSRIEVSYEHSTNHDEIDPRRARGRND